MASKTTVVKVPAGTKPIMEGYLIKCASSGNMSKPWKNRYFRLYQEQLLYFESITAKDPKGIISLSGAQLSLYSGPCFPQHPYCFGIATADSLRTYICSASSVSERLAWVHTLQPLVAKIVKSDPVSLKEGYLTKQGGTIKTWKRRFCVLTQQTLRYYHDADSAKPGMAPIDTLDLTHGLEVEIEKHSAEQGQFIFTVRPLTSQRVYRFACSGETEREQWVALFLHLRARYASETLETHM